MVGFLDAFGGGGAAVAPQLHSRLARAMQELSYGCSSDIATFRGMLQQLQPDGARVDEATVAEVLGVMARTTPSSYPPGTPGTPPPEALAAQLASIAAGTGADGVGWAWKVVMDVLKSTSPNLNWSAVADALDHAAFTVPSKEAFYLLCHAYRYAAGEQVPVKAVAGRRWAHEVGQLSFLQWAVSAPPDVFSFAASEHKLPPVEGLAGGKLSTGTPNQAWLSIDLLQILCHFTVDAHKRPIVLNMLEHPIKHCPEVLLLAMASVPEDTQLLQREVYSVLLPPYLANVAANTSLVLHRLWAVNPKLVKEMLVEYFVQSHDHLPRIHEICRELQALPEVLSDTPSSRFALHLAVYGAQVKQGAVPLESWAQTRLSREPVMMVHEIIFFLYAKTAMMEPAAGARPGMGRLSDEVVTSLVRVLLPVRPQLAWDFQEAYAAMAEGVTKAHPHSQGKALLAQPVFTYGDVEGEATSLLAAMHGRKKSWDQLAGQMQKLKASGSARDGELLAALIRALINEFPSYLYDTGYPPEKDLNAAAMLYQGLITNQLLGQSLSLGLALRCVVIALRAGPGARVVTFGLTVLRHIVRMAQPWGAFCEQALLSPALREAEPELHRRVEEAYAAYQAAVRAGHPPTVRYAMLPPLNLAPPPPGAGGAAAASAPPGAMPAKAPPPGLGGPPVNPPAGAVAGGPPPGAPPAAKVYPSMEGNDIEGELESTLLAPAAAAPPATAAASRPTLGVNTVSLEAASEKHTTPPEHTHDRVHFLINNLSEDSLDKHAGEIKNKVVPEFAGWFSEYMAKRAAQEPNYHPLYLRLLTKMDDKTLGRQLVRSTYYYVRLLLTGDRAVKDSNDRALLKNLGHWLGALTFKRERPVLAKELDLKAMVIEAYQRGRLVSVLPFLSNLLSMCDKSRVFTGTNPMISGLLSLLAELHRLPQLKFNGQYCIEMIFRTFGQAPREWEPTNLLAALPRDTLGNPDFNQIQLPEQADKALFTSPEMASNVQAYLNTGAGRAFSAAVTGMPPPPGSVGARTPVKAGALAAPPPGMAAGAGALPPGMAPQPGGMAGGAAAGAAAAGGPPPGLLSPLLAGPGGEAGKGAEGLGLMRGAAGAAGAAVGQAAAGPPGAPTQTAPAVPQPTGLCMEHNPMIQYLAQNAVINPSLGAIAERLQLKRFVPLAVERAIWEILNPVVERSVTIACYTTFELLSKDFALDGDDTRMRKAAHLMVSSLAGSLSLVTCKDPLRIALSNQLSGLIATSQAGAGIEKGMLDQVVTVVVQDNLESCCSVFERAATDKAVRDVDKQLASKYEERATARKQQRPFVDTSAFHSYYPSQLPDTLRPRQGMVTPQQLRVYEDFARIPRSPPPLTAPAAPGGTAGPGMPGAPRPAGYGEDGAGGKDAAAGGAYEPQYMSWQTLVDGAVSEAEAAGSEVPSAAVSNKLNVLMSELVEFVGGPAVGDQAVAAFAQRIARHLVDVAGGGSKLGTSFYATALRHVADALSSKTGNSLSLGGLWGLVDDERKYSREVVDAVLRAGVVPAADLDTSLARVLLSGQASPAALELAGSLVRSLIARDTPLTAADLAGTLDALSKVALSTRATSPSSAAVAAAEQQLAQIEQARRLAGGAAAGGAAGGAQAAGAGTPGANVVLTPSRSPQELPACVRERWEPSPEVKTQVLQLFDEWLRLAAGSGGVSCLVANPGLAGVSDTDRAALAAHLNSIRAQGWLKDEVSSERWVRLVIDLALHHCTNMMDQVTLGRMNDPHQLYLAVDGLARLLAAVTVHGGGLPFLRTALSVFVGVVKRDADERGVSFNGRPHLRLLVGLVCELPGGTAPSASPEALDPTAMRYLRHVADALYALQPLSVPGWAFCWLSVVSHRAFMPRLLLCPGVHGWTVYEALLVGVLKFLGPHLRGGSADLADGVRALYRGALRLLLVLLHDFPEFLCEHHLGLCDAIPVPCVQLRNLVLSAFPRSMRLPDPFTPGLKVDLLPEILQAPRVVPDPEHLLDDSPALKQGIDSYIRTRTPASVPADIVRAIKASAAPQQDGKPAGSPANGPAAAANGPAGTGGGYNVQLINALVMYVGVTARNVAAATAPPGGSAPNPGEGPALDILLRLMTELDSEGRYLVLNGAANQLRYPNAHTYAFSCLLLGLFADVGHEGVQEQITRVLLERLVVNRPHPWGLLITFIELIKNPRYQFWTHEFTRNGADVERLFKNVAASCMAHGGAPPGPGAAAVGTGGVGGVGPSPGDGKDSGAGGDGTGTPAAGAARA